MYFLSQMDQYTAKMEHHTRENIIICLDEIDLSLHPAWQRDIIYYLVKLINDCYKGKHIQIIMTTHSPLCLSNIPRANIIYMKKTEKGTMVDISEHKETFGTNLYEILDDAFYLKNHSMGRFAKEYIQGIIKEIEQLSCVDDKIYDDYIEKIEYIGDSLVRNKLKEKLLKKRYADKALRIKLLDKEIEQLKLKRRKMMEEE